MMDWDGQAWDGGVRKTWGGRRASVTDGRQSFGSVRRVEHAPWKEYNNIDHRMKTEDAGNWSVVPITKRRMSGNKSFALVEVKRTANITNRNVMFMEG